MTTSLGSMTRLVRSFALAIATLACAPFVSRAQTRSGESYVSSQDGRGRFTLSARGASAPIVLSGGDHRGVIRAANDLRVDVGRVTGVEPRIAIDSIPRARSIVLVGTLGKSALVGKLVREGKLDVTGIAGHWESWILQVVEQPMAGVDRALVIAGSDKRGTIYGLYDLSSQIGVSPWYWWSDVPVQRRASLFVLPGRHTEGEPKVKYRGLFFNDEAPALSGWARETFGGFNHQFYEKAFELILRLKGNYLWPAMWGNAFADDDSLNARLADEYGVVMGPSRHEPMTRAPQE